MSQRYLTFLFPKYNFASYEPLFHKRFLQAEIIPAIEDLLAAVDIQVYLDTESHAYKQPNTSSARMHIYF